MIIMTNKNLLRPVVLCSVGLLLGSITLTACGSTETASPQPISIVSSFYPLQFVAEQIGGDNVSVSNLTPPGAEPHDLELTPQQTAAIGDAQLVIYLGGFQSAVDEAVKQEASKTSLDAGQGLTTLAPTQSEIDEAREEGESAPVADPHIWLDPNLMISVAQRVTKKLTALNPGEAKTFAANLTTLTAQLKKVDSDWKAGTKSCDSRDLVVSHEAFGYLVKRYQFKQVGIGGLSPDTEPSAAKVAEVSDFVNENDVKTIYYETLVDPKVAETVATETGANTAVLDPIEGLVQGSSQDYLSIMRTNLSNVKKGQGCK
jgi:zinc transport system substrate-binding protein